MESLRTLILDQGPTDEQREAIFAEELEYLLRASPGSGKTWTSCRRFIWRGANWNYQVGGLALLSFTNAAIREFHEATAGVGQRRLLSDPNFVGTFDSFVERFIITPFGHLVTGSRKRPRLFLAARPGDRRNKKLLGYTDTASGGKMPVPAWEIVPFPDDGRIAYRASSRYGGKILDFRYTNPVSNFLELGYYTHAQRVFLGCRLLIERPHIADCIARRFPEIVVDEAQDTNIWLLMLLKILREKGTKVTLVGDPDQCIYEFSMADANSLPSLRDEWQIPELPLNKSFRCNDPIAEAVKNVGGNMAFVGCGGGANSFARPFIIRDSGARFSRCIGEFERLLGKAGIPLSRSAILCRGHNQLESIRGDVGYIGLQGNTKQLALAAFQRDVRKDFLQARKAVDVAVRELTNDPTFWEELDDNPDTSEAHRIRLAIWIFTKSPHGGLPALSENGTDWIQNLRVNLVKLLEEIGVEDIPKMGQKIRRTGLGSAQLGLPLFQPQPVFPKIRQATIHEVKGESIDGVLVLGSTKFFNSVISAADAGENTELRRLAYVAMTRARHTLLVGLPPAHFDRHVTTWQEWGFDVL